MSTDQDIKVMGQKGFLAIVSTPIGNLADMTFRALEILKTAQVVAAEDTRRARILLDRFSISARVISCHSHNEYYRVSQLINMVKEGHKVCFLSDAGTPSVSDPGYLILNEAVKAGVEPLIVPGVSALTFSVVASALPVDKFVFYGFLPVKSGRRTKSLLEIAAIPYTVFIFEAPHRMDKLLNEINNLIGPDTMLAIIREATKIHEETIRGTVTEIIKNNKDRIWRGECTVAIWNKNNKQQKYCLEDDEHKDQAQNPDIEK